MDLDRRSLRVDVVTSVDPAGRGHLEIASAALEGGATALQLRAPELDDEALRPSRPPSARGAAAPACCSS